MNTVLKTIILQKAQCQNKFLFKTVSMPLSDYALFREKYDRAQHIVFLTGAGISAESGVPTFRGEGGLWRTFSAPR